MLRFPMVFALALVVTGCFDSSDPPRQEVAAGGVPQIEGRRLDPAPVERGARLYQQHCASCHGAEAEGAPNWRRRDPQGYFPPPPLNGSGHAWHHPRAMLHSVIANGSPGGGKMPAWGDRLHEGEISAIIDWFQSRWPEEIYAAWRDIDQRARRASR